MSQKQSLPNEELTKAERKLHIINHTVRQRIIAFIEQEQETTVAQIWRAVNIPQPHASLHLKKLLEANVVFRYREGKRMYYQVDREKLVALNKLAKQIIEI